MMNDTLSNALSKIMNAETRGQESCKVYPASLIIKRVLEILSANQYIGSFKETEDSKGNRLEVQLIGAINKIGAIRPRFAITLGEFEKFEKRFLPAKDFGLIIVSTSSGMMTHTDAKKKGIGGKLIAYCY